QRRRLFPRNETETRNVATTQQQVGPVTVLVRNTNKQLDRIYFASCSFVTWQLLFLLFYNHCLSQVKFQQAREERKKLLTVAHKYIFDILAERLCLLPAAVEEFILDSPSSLANFDKFFAKGGCTTITFVYQEAEVPGIGMHKITKIEKFWLVILFRFWILLDNMSFYTLQEVCFSMIDARLGLLKGIRDAYSFLLPALDSHQNWGALDKIRHGEKIKKNFKYNMKYYLSTLDGKKNIKCMYDRHKNQTNKQTKHKVLSVAVLIESNQLRKVDDSAGPLSELQHWQRMSWRFNSIVKHIKGQACKSVVMVLHISGSKVMKVWRELDSRITDHANEAKDNVKYLSILEKVCRPLYNTDPVTMMESVQNIINAIQMIFTVSSFYNTRERISALFIKVTNQMVTACRSYITDNGTCQIWDQDTEVIIKKIQVTLTISFVTLLRIGYNT
uniref:Dynein heavy chain tail domain-containing protein n=1 Tax=Echeneis naucrates TaxID=173247 RepID=A0A665W6M9_ECHNA